MTCCEDVLQPPRQQDKTRVFVNLESKESPLLAMTSKQALAAIYKCHFVLKNDNINFHPPVLI